MLKPVIKSLIATLVLALAVLHVMIWGFDFVGCELDEDYWKAQEERFAEHTQQGDLFSGSDLQPFMIGTPQ